MGLRRACGRHPHSRSIGRASGLSERDPKTPSPLVHGEVAGGWLNHGSRDVPRRRSSTPHAEPQLLLGRHECRGEARGPVMQGRAIQRLAVTDRLVRATHPPSVARLTRRVPWLCVSPLARGLPFRGAGAFPRVASAPNESKHSCWLGSGRRTSPHMSRVLHASPFDNPADSESPVALRSPLARGLTFRVSGSVYRSNLVQRRARCHQNSSVSRRMISCVSTSTCTQRWAAFAIRWRRAARARRIPRRRRPR